MYLPRKAYFILNVETGADIEVEAGLITASSPGLHARHAISLYDDVWTFITCLPPRTAARFSACNELKHNYMYSTVKSIA